MKILQFPGAKSYELEMLEASLSDYRRRLVGITEELSVLEDVALVLTEEYSYIISMLIILKGRITDAIPSNRGIAHTQLEFSYVY